MIRDKLLTITGDSDLYIGEKEFLTPGYYRWTVPLAVRRIHVALIGAGSYTSYGRNTTYDGGGGGSLCWSNDIEVVPGEELMIKVGEPHQTRPFAGPETDSIIGRPDDSDPVNNPNAFAEEFLKAGGGKGSKGGTYDLYGRVGDGGYGGDGSGNGGYSGEPWGGAGGGAGGYLGNGGSGTYAAEGRYQYSGAPNSGAAAGGFMYWREPFGSWPGHKQGAGGGGVGIRGRGATGQGALAQPPEKTAIRGTPGSGGSKEEYGAGGANVYDDIAPSQMPDYARPGGGAVRIIWGITYSYPDNADVSK